MTHGVHPFETRKRLLEIAEEVSAIDHPNSLRISDELKRLAGVGWPPRGVQYKATAPIVMHRNDLANNVFASYDPPLQIAPEHRGLRPVLADALARVRTDLDSFSSGLIDLLIAQAYFLTDAHLRLAMPEIVGNSDVDFWDWATRIIAQANANESGSISQLKAEAKVRFLFKR